MKNALTILLCTIVLGCIGGRSVSTSVQNAKLLKPIKLENSGLVVRPIQLAPATPRPAEFKPVRTVPTVIVESVEANTIPLTPPVAAGGNTPIKPTVREVTPIEIKPIEINPIDITPIQPTNGVVLPEIEVEQIVLKEIEIPKPVHVKIFQLLFFYGAAGILIWLGLRWWNKRKKVKAPVKRKRKTRKRS